MIVVACAAAVFSPSRGSASYARLTPAHDNMEVADTVVADSVAEAKTDTMSVAGRDMNGRQIQTSRPKRTVTPVESDDGKPEQPTLHFFDKHGNPLETPVYFLTELDTVAAVRPGPTYPLLNGVSVGVNFVDAILMAAGQKYGSFDLWADLSLHNWFFPVVELGAGFAGSTPQEGNFTYKGKPSFYAKVGMNYNFLYKSKPDYQAFLGFRAGFSHFTYDVTDITVNSSYWGEVSHFSLTGQKANCLYGEVLGGVKVKLYRQLSMGWTIRYHFKFHTSGSSGSNPWFVPGYGASSPISFSFSLIYTLPFGKSSSAD